MSLYTITKDDLPHFLHSIRGEVYVPTKTDAVRFSKYQGQEIWLTSNTDFPLKEFFFKQREQLFQFKKNTLTVKLEKPKKRVFFGIRRCDLNAIAHQDFIFMEKYQDPYYTTQRKHSILIGYHCNTPPSKYCFCGSMDLKDYYDMMFWNNGDHYLVHAKTTQGKSLLTSAFHKAKKRYTKSMATIDYTNRLKNKNIEKLYDNPDWKKGSNRCISCAACTTLCPTCYCHEIKDEVSIKDLQQGERVREWSSCQLKSFTRVAGDHVFRDDREERFKHRIYHQLQYFKERYNIEMCTGCGRCITHCPTQIDFVEIINEMEQ